MSHPLSYLICDMSSYASMCQSLQKFYFSIDMPIGCFILHFKIVFLMLVMLGSWWFRVIIVFGSFAALFVGAMKENDIPIDNLSDIVSDDYDSYNEKIDDDAFISEEQWKHLSTLGIVPLPSPTYDQIILERRRRENPSSLLVNFGVVSDVHFADLPKLPGKRNVGISDEKLLEAIELFNQVKPAFLFMNGDFKEYDDNSEEKRDTAIQYLREIEDILQLFNGPVFHTVGNHDIDVITKNDYFENTHNHKLSYGSEQRFYSFNTGPIHFIVVESNFDQLGNDMWSIYENRHIFSQSRVYMADEVLLWLRDDLATHKHMNVIVFSHHRLDVGHEKHSPRNVAKVREILESHGGVLCVVEGHDHSMGDNLQRINGIGYYIQRPMVLANGGFSIFELDSNCNLKILGYNYAISVEFLFDGSNPDSFCNPNANQPLGDNNVVPGVEDDIEEAWIFGGQKKQQSIAPSPTVPVQPLPTLTTTPIPTLTPTANGNNDPKPMIIISELVHKADLEQTPTLTQDWLELCCLGPTEGDISGWFLTDLQDTDVLQFPENTIIAAGHCRVWQRFDIGSFVFGLNTVDALELFDTEMKLIDSTTWGLSGDEVSRHQSWSRVCDENGKITDSFAPSDTKTPGSMNIGCTVYFSTAAPTPTEMPHVIDDKKLIRITSMDGTLCLSNNNYFIHARNCMDTPLDIQWWELTSIGAIRNPYTGQCIDVRDDAGKNWGHVRNYLCRGLSKQQWRITTSGQLISKRDGLCTILGSDKTLRMYNCNGTRKTKIWRIIDYAGFEVNDIIQQKKFKTHFIFYKDAEIDRCVTGGTYYITGSKILNSAKSEQHWEFTTEGHIISKDNGKCFDVQDSKNWASIRLIICRGKPSQRFVFDTIDGTLRSKLDGRCIIVASDGRLKTHEDCSRSPFWIRKVIMQE